jgi:hypothetical protein
LILEVILIDLAIDVEADVWLESVVDDALWREVVDDERREKSSITNIYVYYILETSSW